MLELTVLLVKSSASTGYFLDQSSNFSKQLPELFRTHVLIRNPIYSEMSSSTSSLLKLSLWPKTWWAIQAGPPTSTLPLSLILLRLRKVGLFTSACRCRCNGSIIICTSAAVDKGVIVGFCPRSNDNIHCK